MGDAVSTILVKILGDARGLTTALTAADSGIKGTALKLGGGLLALGAVKKGFDVIGDFIDDADRANDAAGRLQSTIGATDTAKLQSIADGFANIGESAPDFLEIAAGFSEFATASGKLTPEQITDMAAGVAQFAGALGALKDVDPASLGDDISNFISGSRGAVAAGKELGVAFDGALTPAQRYAELMDRLPGLLENVTGAGAGLDDKQRELNAKFETFGSHVGPVFEDAASQILGTINDWIDAIPGAVQGYQMLGKAIEDMARDALTPVARLADALNGILDLAGQVAGATTNGRSRVGGTPGNGLGAARSESRTVADSIDFDERNGGARTVNNRIGGP